MSRTDAHYRRGPSAHSPTSRLLALAADSAGGPSSSSFAASAAAGGAGSYTFPPLFLDPDRAAAHESEFGNPDEHSALWALPSLQYETIAVPEGLIPPAIDNDADVLPSEQHTSYPYGNPFAGLSAHLNTPFASRPLLDPKLHLNLELAHAAESRARLKVEEPMLDEALLAGPGMGGGGMQGGGAAGMAAAAASTSAASADGGGPVAQDYTLAHHLQLRASTAHGPTNPRWPFKRFGPGRTSSASPSGGAGALLRAERERVQLPVREVWADLALEALLPRGKVLPFQPSSSTSASNNNQSEQGRLYAGGTTRAEGDPLLLGLQAPDRVLPPQQHRPNNDGTATQAPWSRRGADGGRIASALREEYHDLSGEGGGASTATMDAEGAAGTVEERLARAMALTAVRDHAEASHASRAGAGPSGVQPTSAAQRDHAARMRAHVSYAHWHFHELEAQAQGRDAASSELRRNGEGDAATRTRTTRPWPLVLPLPLR